MRGYRASRLCRRYLGHWYGPVKRDPLFKANAQRCRVCGNTLIYNGSWQPYSTYELRP